MKNLKLLMILLMMMLTYQIMSQSNISNRELEIEKIEYNGQQGYFISVDYWQEIELIINEYHFLQKNYLLLEKENEILYNLNTKLQKKIKYEHIKNNFLAGSIGFNVAMASLLIGFTAITYANK